ncbi:hypothetical protein [Nonomuraea sp. NPDC049158]|uniref:hypothetical protein n=1 Tax=Nonomuraea sp. NPDC049158 TaxID=3155649 RepID=UPI0033EE605D
MARGTADEASAAAAELGADLTTFWDRVAANGPRVPPAWLGHGGWPALWSRAARNTRRTALMTCGPAPSEPVLRPAAGRPHEAAACD